ncbi:ferredoxin [Halegenticoccus tardaugens]|uniref:ferredoxin n=1 Tax=Halegenticoccus tardaugens TaxID=2071624 RepID=UPI00100ABE5D|nr:ferredoxin [Halegenticoccus tardaugens]
MYEIELDRGACEGIFACLVRDPRFVEAADGLAAIETDGGEATDGETDGGESKNGETAGGKGSDGAEPETADGVDRRIVARFDDDRLDEARRAAAACPVGAIAVAEVER